MNVRLSNKTHPVFKMQQGITEKYILFIIMSKLSKFLTIKMLKVKK